MEVGWLETSIRTEAGPMGKEEALTARLDRPKSLTDLAVERIRATIVEGTLGLGQQISEAALASQLGISKTPVREALLRLRADGLVDIHPQRGTYVFRVYVDDVVQICRFREILESAALAEALAADRKGLIAALEANLRAMKEAQRASDASALPELDAEFHGIIMQRSNNAYLRDAYRLIEHKIHALRWRLPANSEQIAHCQANHAILVKQIREGKLGQAQAILKRHIRGTQDAYLQAGGIFTADTG
jgi:DNA-binding GntR family transcriptional regulator